MLLSVVGLVSPAAAQPAPEPQPSGEPASGAEPPPIVFEGGTTEMRAQLDETQIAWVDAKAALDASRARQLELAETLGQLQVQIDIQSVELGKIARAAYVSSGQTAVGALVGSDSLEGLLDELGLLDALATRQTNLINELAAARRAAQEAQAGIEQEAVQQEALLAEMEARKQQAQLALCRAAVGICDDAETGSFSARASAVAVAAPRNPDGSFPVEYLPRDRVLERSVTGTSATAYITPRTAHAVTQAKAAGFTLYVACFGARTNVSEHPKGRACDFAVDPSCTFCGDAGGGAKAYGDDLADFLVFNAERLGVLYVIWYHRIWLASTGRWKPYSGGRGDPSSDHTNHVHLSIR